MCMRIGNIVMFHCVENFYYVKYEVCAGEKLCRALILEHGGVFMGDFIVHIFYYDRVLSREWGLHVEINEYGVCLTIS